MYAVPGQDAGNQTEGRRRGGPRKEYRHINNQRRMPDCGPKIRASNKAIHRKPYLRMKLLLDRHTVAPKNKIKGGTAYQLSKKEGGPRKWKMKWHEDRWSSKGAGR